jgi:hypothetical protein
MSIWNNLYSFRTRTYLERFPKTEEIVMCKLINKDEHGFIFMLVDYQLQGRLIYKNAHGKRKAKVINKLFTSTDKLYPLQVSSIEFLRFGQKEILPEFEESNSEGSEKESEQEEESEESESEESEKEESESEEEESESDKEESEKEESEKEESETEVKEENKCVDGVSMENEIPYIMLSNLGITDEFKDKKEEEYRNYIQIFGLIHKYSIDAFKKQNSKSRPDLMSARQFDEFFESYKVYVEGIMSKTIWKLPRDQVFTYVNEFKNKFKEDTVFDLDPKDKKELAIVIKKQLHNPDYTIDYFFELTTIRFSLDEEQSGYHFLKNVFKKALDMNRDKINMIDPNMTIKLKNIAEVAKDGKVVSKKTQKALSYSVYGKSQDENGLKGLAEDIINSIQQLKGPFESFKKLEISIHNSETHQVKIIKCD